jgi:hypothetical protein
MRSFFSNRPSTKDNALSKGIQYNFCRTNRLAFTLVNSQRFTTTIKKTRIYKAKSVSQRIYIYLQSANPSQNINHQLKIQQQRKQKLPTYQFKSEGFRGTWRWKPKRWEVNENEERSLDIEGVRLSSAGREGLRSLGFF